MDAYDGTQPPIWNGKHWLCPECLHALAEDGIWVDGEGVELELWACHDCGFEFGRPVVGVGED